LLKEEVKNIQRTAELLLEVNLGATAIGTGLNTPKEYSPLAVKKLAEVTGFPCVPAEDLIEATSDCGAYVMVHGALKRLAVKMSKICNDLRLLSSGPRAGLNEINLPELQAGSSIMPAKVNPVVPEVVNQVCFKVIGNDTTVTMAAESGQLELNAFEPVLFYNLFESIETLKNATTTLIDNCIEGITANKERCKELVENSVGIVTALCPYIGYKNSSVIAKKSLNTGTSIRQIVLEEKILSRVQLEEVLDPFSMTAPGSAKLNDSDLVGNKAI
ncbi:MAG: Aspartate ammonia-lyase, partial [Escherichia coli DORA_A_5_14_21]